MDAVADPTVTEIWVMKSAQVGWTEILNNVIGYHIDQDAAPMLLVQPTLEMAEAWSKDRLAPMIRDTVCLRDKISGPKSKDSGNTLLHKKFTGGHLTVAGANSAAGLASRPIRVALFDEVDRFPASAGTEGDPFTLGKKRTTTFWNRKILAGSTPTIKGSSRVETGFDSSDQRFYFVPCPHCGEFQRLVWAQVQWPEGQPELAQYVCVHCAALIPETCKQAMLLAGEWRATKDFRGIAGFHISELYSPWSTWAEMAVSFLRAKPFPETFQTWINTSLGETWEDKGEALEPKGLQARVETYTHQDLPPGILLLTAGVDVQDARLEVTVQGWGIEEESWRVEHIELKGDPGSSALWAELDAVLLRRWSTDDGRSLTIEATAVDSGGHFTDQVYRFCRARKRRRVFAIKGVGGMGRAIWPPKATRAARLRVQLWLIGVDTAKDVIYGRLKKITEPAPGYFHFDAATTAEYFTQLTSETLVYKVIQGRRVRMWKPRSTTVRQEALDCLVYAYAAYLGRGGPRAISQRAAVRAHQQQLDDAAAQQHAAEPQEAADPAAEPAATPDKPAATPDKPAAPAAKPRTVSQPRPRRWVSSWRR
jgi:phage terminase large subunit GpA-like protein